MYNKLQKKRSGDNLQKKIESNNKLSIILLIFIIIIYTAISFINLGSFKMPKTKWTAIGNKRAIFEFNDIKHIKRIQYLAYPYSSDYPYFDVYYTTDYNDWKSIKDIEIGSFDVFRWSEIELDADAVCVNIISHYNNLSLLEVAFRDSNDNLIKYETNEENLHDEENLVPKKITDKNSMYFDEIYHARTANEMIEKTSIYEITHPPLGKFIISLGIRLFGMNPFGFRIIGNLFGIFMIPMLYLFSKEIFKNKFWALFTTIIFTFDFMHFTQTRIATLDSYLTLFVIISYYFMYKYYTATFSNNKTKDFFLFLGFSGIFMGFSIATKWQGVYSAIGLFIVFLISIINKYEESYSLHYKKEKNYKKHFFSLHLLKTFIFCIIFFIIVPIGIYILSYLPCMGTENFNKFSDILDNQIFMYKYHSTLEGSHYYASKWWEWPILVKPLLFYSQTFGEKKGAISTFGNPFVWLPGILAFFYTLIYTIEEKSKTTLFLLIAYLSQYVPWMFIKRETFIYHYFPSVPFLTLMITFMFKELFELENRFIKYIYLTSVVILFIMFYPVLSGYPVSPKYVNIFLKWFSEWVLIY